MCCIERNATVTKLKSLDLTDTRVIAFATHGLIASGILPALAEPALALTPPAAPDQRRRWSIAGIGGGAA